LNKIKWSAEEEWGSSEARNSLFDGSSHPIEMDTGCKFGVMESVLCQFEAAVKNFMNNCCMPFKLRA